MLARIVGALVAVAIVAIVIVVINVAHGGHGSDSPNIAASSTSETPPASTSSAAPTTPPPVTSSTPIPKPTVTPTAPVVPTVTPGSRGTIYVYNASHDSAKLAHAVARLTAAGYFVRHTNTISVQLTDTTVFYNTGKQGAARAMVNLHLGVLAAKPRSLYLANTGTLIVVVTSTYP